jgi:hypothetical protein
MTAQAGGSIGGGQGFVRNLGRALFGPPPEEISAARTTQATERGMQLLRQQAQNYRDAIVPNAIAEADGMRVMRPVLLGQAEDAQGLAIRGRDAEADTQIRTDAAKTGLLKDVMNTGVEGKQRLNQDIFAQTKDLVGLAQQGDLATQRAFFGETPFSQQLFGHVAGESAANRALELEIARRNTAPWQVGAALQAGGLAGLFLS